MLCRRCKLYSLVKAKIIAQESSLHFVILYVLTSSHTRPFQKGVSGYVNLSMLSAKLIQRLVQRSPCPHFCCLFLQRAACLVGHLFSRPCFHFLRVFCEGHFNPLRDVSAWKVFLPSFFVPRPPPTSRLLPIALLTGSPVASIFYSSSSSFSICEQSQL